MDMRPLRDRVVVKPKDADGKSKGGVYLPDTAQKDRPTEGQVVAIGTGRLSEKGDKLPFEVKVGDKVIYGEYSGSEVKIEGQKYVILKEDDILAIC